MTERQPSAPGAPGLPAQWTSSAKSGIGTALSARSLVWFTLCNGHITEVYYPRADQACLRQARFMVTDGRDFFADEAEDTSHQVSFVHRGAPAFKISNTCLQQKFRIEKDIISDPGRHVLLQRVRFVPLHGKLEDFRLYFVAEPHLENHGQQNTAWIADYWNDHIEAWTYRTGTSLAQRFGVEGHYIRIAPKPGCSSCDAPSTSVMRSAKSTFPPPDETVSPDALALVRFGLRAPNDPRILNTIKVVDALLKVETPLGPAWRRYNGDDYGEKLDGSPFEKQGVGRAWPLLTGERAHYELSADQPQLALKLLRAFEGFANEQGFIPEQVWDAADIPERQLFLGRPTGSAMPLAWAHAEHLKLLRSLRDGKVFDMPELTLQRYQIEKRTAAHAHWRFQEQRREMPAGKLLRLETFAPALVRWSADDWRNVHEIKSRPAAFGIHVADLPSAEIQSDRAITFTFFWPEANHWENRNFTVRISGPSDLT